MVLRSRPPRVANRNQMLGAVVYCFSANSHTTNHGDIFWRSQGGLSMHKLYCN